MKYMDLSTYRDKVTGCWTGKNIGGVLGAPFEGMRQINRVDFYQQDLSMGPPPNDDLDLQIVWLAAVERYGRNVNASILGEYWLSYVIPNWVEYGMGKANLRAGLQPPLSGLVDNTYKDSNGSWIRSEIWACLAPGHPETAARYAYEDAIVDHAGEGVYGEIFFAALESAAFVENDKFRLIDIGLSYIPEDCFVSRAVRTALTCYREGRPFLEARELIHGCAPGTFGIQGVAIKDIPAEGNENMELGQPGFDAPENVAFAVAGWLYGEDDFGKSLCLANMLGEDTDCTCATLGAVMGILLGASGIPEKWAGPLNDKIATMCIDKTSGGIWVPDTVTQLTERILRVMPGFLGAELCDILAPGGMRISCLEGEALFDRKGEDYLYLINGNGKPQLPSLRELCSMNSGTVRYEFPAFCVLIDYGDGIFFRGGEEIRFRVSVLNRDALKEQHWARISLFLPDGVTAPGGRAVQLPLNNLYGSRAEAEFVLCTEGYCEGRLECIVDISLPGRHSTGACKLIFMRRA